MTIYDKIHTIWTHISLCGVISCNNISKYTNSEARLYCLLDGSFWYLAAVIVHDAKMSDRTTLTATLTQVHKRHFMIRFIQFGLIYLYVVSFYAIYLKLYEIWSTVIFYIWRRDLATVISHHVARPKTFKLISYVVCRMHWYASREFYSWKYWKYLIFCFLDLTWSAEQLFFPWKKFFYP